MNDRDEAIQAGAEAIVGEHYDILPTEGVEIATAVLDAAEHTFLYHDQHELLHNHAAGKRIADRDYQRCREEVEELAEKLQTARTEIDELTEHLEEARGKAFDVG